MNLKLYIGGGRGKERRGKGKAEGMSGGVEKDGKRATKRE